MRARSVGVPLSSLFQRSKRLLLREYIRKSLYDPAHGYFSNKKSPLLQHSDPLRFRSIKNRAEYQATVASTYASSPHGWMTPVELFSPYLSRAIANRLRSLVPSDGNISVIEFGAGRGTLARDILSHWETTDDPLLSKASYYVVEISEAMTQLQKQTLEKWIDRGIVKIFNEDAVHWFSTFQSSSEAPVLTETHCHVLGTEVLDNMPHDLVRFRGDRLEQAELLISYDETLDREGLTMKWTGDVDVETMDVIQGLGVLSEQTLEDGFASPGAGLAAYLRGQFEDLIGAGSRDIWIPTASYQLLRSIIHAIPHASVTLGDFDAFPGALPGVNGPVVQTVDRGSAIVFDAVHTAPFGKADIMFPTNFDWLRRGHASLSDAASPPTTERNNRFVRRVISQQEFFDEYGSKQDEDGSTCRDGYNPILQDFENASFLLVDSVR